MERYGINKEIPIHEITFAGYTILRGVTPDTKKIGGRVVFLYQNDNEFKKLLTGFYQDKVVLADYLEALKKAKSLMYQTKEAPPVLSSKLGGS